MKKYIWVFAILAVMVLQGWALFSWTKKDTRPLAWDQAVHTNNTYSYIDRIPSHRWLEIMKPASFTYPPLYHFTLIPFLNRVPDIADAGAAANFFYLCLLMLSVFLIGDSLLGRWPAFTAMTIVACYPAIAVQARQTLIDLSLTAWVSLAFLCLFKSEDFSKRGWSVGFGISLGLAMLAKWTAFFYLAGPALYSAVRALLDKRWTALVWPAMVAALVMTPWYLPNIVPILARLPAL